MKRFRWLAGLAVTVLFLSGCVYYNTFYNARKSFDKAEGMRKEQEKMGKPAQIAKGDYTRARDKSQKIIDKYPTSGWYDDALFVNGVSHYYLGDYNRAERRFREIMANYAESPYVRDARLYLAKSKLKQKDMAEARVLFERLFAESREKDVKAEAAMALGEFYFENREYEKATEYFVSIVDSLGDGLMQKKSQLYIADALFARFKYRSAMDAYLKVFDFNPTTEEKFRINYQAGRCSYMLNDVEGGMAYFNKLAVDEFYYDSLGSIKLQIARGYELDNDLVLAEETYRQIAEEFPNKASGVIANYNLGLIYQYDYEDYEAAKGFYDKAKQRIGGEVLYQDALQRSTNIGKLEEYRIQEELDTAATPDEIDSAAATQYLLGELYLLQLEIPDSAYQEFMYAAESFDESIFAPKALIAAALIRRDFYGDTLGCDSLLREVLRKYPRSDFIPEAIGILGLAGTAADSGYPLWYYRKAEEFLFDDSLIDSAHYYYAWVADSFSRSQYNLPARYASIWVLEEYASPGDSSLVYAYAELADSFPASPYGKEADKKIAPPKRRTPPRDLPSNAGAATESASGPGDTTADTSVTTALSDDRFITPEEKYYIDPEGNSIQEVREGPIRCEKEFIYPPAAYTSNFEGNLYVQIKLDAFGQIVDYRLMNPTPSQEMDMEVREVVMNCRFDTGWIDPEETNFWWIYKYRVVLPSHLK